MHEALKEELIETDDDFRRLHEEHQACEHQLETILQSSMPSQGDEIEIKRIKLHKLALKDRMEAMMVAHEREAAATPA